MTDTPAEDYPTRPVTVTCETADCANAGIGLEVNVPAEQDSPAVVCGVCGRPITAVVARDD